MIRFRRNMSNLDRAVRAIIGVTLLTVGPITEFITADTLSNVLLGLVGSLALLSALFSYCVLYDLTGLGLSRTKD